MIQNRVTVVFQPTGGSAADAINAANQQVFLDVTPGTMTAARTNASGLLVSGPGAGTPVALDDTRDFSVVVLPTAPTAPPAATAGTRVRLAGPRLVVTPQIAIRVTNGTAPVPSLACHMTIGTATSNVTTGATGFIISNDQSSGALTLSCDTRLLRATTASVPTVTLALATTPVERGATARINVTAPAGVPNFHVTEWRYELSHTNPDGNAVSGTITRPSTEASSTVDQFWEGQMCASGTARALFVTGVTIRASGAGTVAASVVAMDPQPATLAVTVNARTWTTPLTQNTETTFTRAIATFHDTGQHGWDAANVGQDPSANIGAGPNRSCRFAASRTALAFTSSPRINADVVNLTSAFQSAQGSVRVLAPPSVRGQTVAPPLVTIAANGALSIPNSAALLSALGLTPAQAPQVRITLCIAPAELLAGTRTHEHLGTISHKQNCLRAMRALDPVKFIEGWVQGPGGRSINFLGMLQDRATKVHNVAPTHNELDETATQSAGDLRFVTGTSIPNVNLTPTRGQLTVWNPTANAPLT